MSIQNILLFLVEFFSDVMLIAKLLKEHLYIFFLINCLFLRKKKKKKNLFNHKLKRVGVRPNCQHLLKD